MKPRASDARRFVVLGGVLSAIVSCSGPTTTPTLTQSFDPLTCENDELDDGEADVDCGGHCEDTCAIARRCQQDRDCTSRVCIDARCQSSRCLGTCGADCIDRCALGETCMAHGDCSTGYCLGSTGSSCPQGGCYCEQGSCDFDQECRSGSCVGGACVLYRCDDGIRNGDESDVDCGGSCPKRCEVVQRCRLASDCSSLSCAGGMCAAPTCFDGVKNGSEQLVDCRGSCPIPCRDGAQCTAAQECRSGFCSITPTGRVCDPATCHDGAIGIGESDVDCGRGCARKCSFDQACSSYADCSSGLCSGGKCGPSSTPQ